MLVLESPTGHDVNTGPLPDSRPAEPTDHHLVMQMRHGDRASFAGLINRYQRRLVGYLHSQSGDLELSRDLAQEAFLKLMKRPPSLNAEQSLKPWLFAVGRNALRDHWRRAGKSQALEDADRHEDPSPAPDEHLGRLEDRAHVRRLVAKLPEQEKEIVHLRMYAGMTFAEIADTLGIPLGTALWRMKRALTWIKKWWFQTEGETGL